jgi:formylglycine-generating enzyme required for sulfatase activity
VLLPGGRVPVAANASDKQDASLTEVDVDPFFLSKYEMTQEQWRRIEGWEWPDRKALMPATGMSWDDCQVALARVDWLRLSTEAQWEYGCRARTTSTWWPGDDPETLRGVANIDLVRDDRPSGAVQAIGRLLANPFGLLDVHGNVLEWCQDAHYGSARRNGDGLKDYAAAALLVFRGGGYWDEAEYARSSLQLLYAPDSRSVGRGLRPARGITP